MGRRLGQHFLFDPTILDRIVDALEPQLDDAVIEIGAGQGTLTRRLAARVRVVIAIERDRELAAGLEGGGRREEGPSIPGNVTVVAQDALKLDWHTLLPPPSSLRGFKVTGNIPYQITSPLIEKALTPPLPSVIVFLVQREVADRLAASPGGKSYGALTVGVQVVAVVERLFGVRAGAFRPPPNVNSAVVRFTPRDNALVRPDDQPAFRRFVTDLFSQRRKQLGRVLRAVTGLEKEAVGLRLAEVGVDPTARPETLGPPELARLFQAVSSGRLRINAE